MPAPSAAEQGRTTRIALDSLSPERTILWQVLGDREAHAPSRQRGWAYGGGASRRWGASPEAARHRQYIGEYVAHLDSRAGLDGRVGIVTGAGSGIGRATARRMAAEGVSVLVADINGASAAATAEMITNAGGSAMAHVTDIADEVSVATMVKTAVDRYGALHLLHNNAANVFVVPDDQDVIRTTMAVWDATFATNVRGTFMCCKYALPAMLDSGGGAVVNMSSNSGQMGDLLRVAYGTSKAAVESLTRYVATMYGKQGIRCNAISPGVVATPALKANVSEVELAMFADHHLTPHIAEPDDIAAAVVFLMSDEARFITGQVLNVDGGMLAHTPLFQQMRAITP